MRRISCRKCRWRALAGAHLPASFIFLHHTPLSIDMVSIEMTLAHQMPLPFGTPKCADTVARQAV